MLQAKGHQLRAALLLLVSTVWEAELYPDEWRLALVSPVYKGKGKRRDDPASYRGVYLTCHLTKLFETLLLRHLLPLVETHNLASSYQFAQKGYQGHDAIYTLMGTALNNKQESNSPTHCAHVFLHSNT